MNAFLSELHSDTDENFILPKSYILLLLRFTHEATAIGYIEDMVDYTKYAKAAAQT